MFGFHKNRDTLIASQKVKGLGVRRLIPAGVFLLKVVCGVLILSATASALLAAGVVGKSFYYFVAKSDYFELSHLDISPDISDEVREEIIELSGLKVHNSVNLLRFNAERARQAILTHPKIRAATVSKVYPRRAVIQGREREPVAIVCSGGFFLIDEEANVLSVADNKALASGFPFITGAAPERMAAGRRIAAPYMLDALNVLMALRRADRELLALVSEIQLDAVKGVTLILKGGMEARLGTEDPSRKLPMVSFFVKQHPEIKRYEYLDLRFENQMIFKARERSAQ
ncbi:MAG: cell division protein FtsQ/DivIB [Candidatus Sumerlaeota bacterium]|nr:cell division protein FtsQ/DivIB [Candidatus Sumerlaeota bacterium]